MVPHCSTNLASDCNWYSITNNIIVDGTYNSVPGLVSDGNSATDNSALTSSIAPSTTRLKYNNRGRGIRGGRYQGNVRQNNSRQNNNYARTQHKGTNDELTILRSVSEGPRRDQFIQFQSELEQHVLKPFSGPDDIASLVKDLEDPSDRLRKQMPIIEDIEITIISQCLDKDTDKEEIAIIKESPKHLYQQEMKLYATRKKQLRSNRSKRFGTIWNQCTPTLQSEVINLNEYTSKRMEYDCL